MMKKHLAMLAAFVCAAISVSSAMAANEGGYSLISGGVTPLTDTVTTTISLGISLGGGYNFNKNVGIEGQLVFLGMATTNNLSAHPLALTINGYLPVQEGLNLFGKIGAAYTTVSDGTVTAPISHSGVTRVYGYGLEFSSGGKNKYRFGVDHYDLSVAPGMPLSTNYINVTAMLNY